MGKIFYFQSFPDIIYDESGKKIRELVGKFDRIQTCQYINDVYEVDDLFITNNSAYYHYIKDRCRVKCKYEEFENKFTEGFVEYKKPYKKKVKLTDDYIFKFGKYKGEKLKDVPEDYVTWFKLNIPQTKW